MKSIFKSFALVAAAAMAFTACQNDIEVTTGGGDVEATTTVHVVANLNSTRSAFGDKIDAGYTSHWNGGEVAKAYVVSDGGFDNYYNVSASTPATVVAQDGAESATIDLAFSGTLSSGVLYIVTAADGSVVDCAGTGYNYYGGQKPVITIPMEQTPDADGKSVDPKAHILIYKDENFRPSKLNSLEVDFSHYAAYGKLNLRNAPEGVESYILDINGNKYVVNSSRTTDVWFACEPAVVDNMSVTVNTAAGAYTKKIVDNRSRELKFDKGAVSKFTVNMEGVTSGEEVDTFTAQYMASNVYFDAAGDLVFEVDAYETFKVRLNQADRPDNTTILEGDYVGINSSSVGQGKFSVYQKIKGGYSEGWTSTTTNSSMNVAYVGGMYQILVNYDGGYGGDGQVGYKGLPEGWVAPAGGGDVTPEPEKPTQLAQPTNLTATATADTATITWTAVAYASSYNVTVGTITKNVTTNTATFEGLDPDTTYNVSVVAVGDGTDYTDSTAATTTVKTSAASTGGDDWTGREVKLQLLGYQDNAIYANVNNESIYMLTSFRNGITAGKFNLAGNNKSEEILNAGHATSQYGLFGSTTPFVEGDTLEVIDNGGGQYTIIYRVDINGDKITATYTGGLS